MDQHESYVRTTFEGDFVYLVTSYRTQGRHHYNAHGTCGRAFTWYSMFTSNCS